jgi:photosystem II stability/assembly factor-like uncharacterized protein
MSGTRSSVVASLLCGLAFTALKVETPAQDEPARRGRERAQPAEEGAAEPQAEGATLPESWMKALEWRSVGPANMSGRITALAVVESDPSTWWAATASGGLLKTTNNGVDFEHQFDREAVVSIGDVQVAESDPDIVWVGTGEANPRNSVSWGNGVYKSTDGGKTWKHMGLEKSYQIGRMAIHPEDPNVVYVGALGRLWGANEERGLYKTTDGGENWERILYVDADTGVIDVDLMPDAPDTLLVATYVRRRDGHDGNDPAVKWGPGAGLWKSTDAGASFQRITTGLPTCELGRIDVEYYRSDPRVVFAVVESSKIGLEPEDAAYLGVSGEDADVGARVTEVAENSPAAAAGLKVGDIVVEVDGEIVESFDDLVAKVRRHLAGATVGYRLSREREIVKGEVTFARYPEAVEDRGQEPPAAVASGASGARGERASGTAVEAAFQTEAGNDSEPVTPPAPTERATFRDRLGGQAQNVQEQQGPHGHEYGGLYKSSDGGESWTRINSVNPRPMYFSQVRVDPTDANHVYVLGVQLHRSKDGGQSFTSDGAGGGVHVDHHALWIDPRDGRHALLGNDGGIYVTWDRFENWDHLNHVAIGQFYHVALDSRRNYRAYGGLQDNGTWGGPVRARDGGTRNEDWISIGGGDGFVCQVDPEDPDLVYFESQNGALGRRNLRTGERGSMRPQAPRGTRYRWNWETPFILSAHNTGIYYTAGNHVFRSWLRGDDLAQISPEITRTDRGSATALSESPLDPGVLYVGTDDGALWVTKNGGHEWTSLFPFEREAKEPSAPAATIAASAPAPPPAEADGDGNGQEPAVQEPATTGIAGRWTIAGGGGPSGETGGGQRQGGRRGRPGGQGGMALDLAHDAAGALTGTLTTPRGESPLTSGSFDAETGELRAVFGEAEFATTITAKLEQDTLKGALDFGGRFQRDFEATRGAASRPAAARSAASGGKPLAELTPGHLWVSSLEASRFEEGRVYLALDGHRSDDDRPWIFASEDRGATWRSLRANLPDGCGSSRVLREDRENEDLLYLGTEFGAWVSIDRGASWTRMNSNLPTVAVHDFAQHEASGDVVAATHGRSLWVLDVTPLRQLSKEAVAADVRLYRPGPAVYWRTEPRRGATLRRYEGELPGTEAEIFYSLGAEARGATLRVKSAAGETLAELETATEPGLHRASWNLRPASSEAASSRGGPPQAGAFGGGGGGGGGRGRRGAPRVAPGTYLVELRIGSQTLTQPLVVQGDPDYPSDILWGLEHERQMELEAELQGVKEEAPTPRLKVL